MTARATAMLREMEAALDMTAIAALDQLVAQASSRMFSAVEVDQAGIARLRELAKEGTLVLLPSHKSHMDYVVLAWILYRHKLPMPVIAAGDNLNFLPVGPVLRRAGAFFIRRKFSGDRLYASVVDAYVRRLHQGRFAPRVLSRGRPIEDREALASEARTAVARRRRGARRPDAHHLVLPHQHRLRALRRGEGVRARADRRRQAEGERARARQGLRAHGRTLRPAQHAVRQAALPRRRPARVRLRGAARGPRRHEPGRGAAP